MIKFSVDMRTALSPVRDQRTRSTCMAFAASDGHALAHARPMSDLSTEYAHFFACRRMPSFEPHQGTSGVAMLDAIRLDGQPLEAEWPYLKTLPSDLASYKPPSTLTDIFRRVGEELKTLDEADAALEAGLPVIMGVGLSRTFYQLRDDSILLADPDLLVAGRHAVLGVGRYLSPEGYGYLVRNSWGSRWGAGGYGLISRAYLEPRILFLGVFRG